jgi:hypothetical protein
MATSLRLAASSFVIFGMSIQRRGDCYAEA